MVVAVVKWLVGFEVDSVSGWAEDQVLVQSFSGREPQEAEVLLTFLPRDTSFPVGKV
jgi:hypothetical protein